MLLTSLASPTKTFKMNGQWLSSTSFDLGNDKSLKIITQKNEDGILSVIAQGVTVEESEGNVIEEFSPVNDFNVVVIKKYDTKRVTEQTVKETHSEALEMIEKIYEDAFCFYN